MPDNSIRAVLFDFGDTAGTPACIFKILCFSQVFPDLPQQELKHKLMAVAEQDISQLRLFTSLFQDWGWEDVHRWRYIP